MPSAGQIDILNLPGMPLPPVFGGSGMRVDD